MNQMTYKVKDCLIMKFHSQKLSEINRISIQCSEIRIILSSVKQKGKYH